MKSIRLIWLLALLTLLLSGGCTPGAPATEQVYTFQSTEVQIPSRGTEIPATLVVPQGAENQKFPLVVMHHGHGGGRNENGGFTRIAESLAERGIASIRMDFAGAGDSTEPFSNLSHTSMMADSNAALTYALRNAPVDIGRVGGFGYSEGSTIVSILAGSPFTPYKAVALLGPVANPDALFTSFFGGPEQFAAYYEEAKAQGSSIVTTPFGQQQDTGLQWFNETLTADPLSEIKNFKGDVLILHGVEEQIVPRSEAQAFLDTVKGTAASSELIEIPGAEHGYGFYSDQPEVTTQVNNSIVEFFVDKLK